MTQHPDTLAVTEDTNHATPLLDNGTRDSTSHRNIPAGIARSWLLVNAMKTELFDQSAVSRADSIILDIEDAVDPSQKDVARENVVNWLSGGGQGWVRINDATSKFWAEDLAVGNLPGPIDGPTVGTNHPILREQTGVTVMMGMTGKLCLAIDQTSVINEVISPTPSDVAWATDFMADFEANGRVIRDGSDLPRLGRAEKIMKLAVAFGVQPAL
jgi:citrate lyase beta subunit